MIELESPAGKYSTLEFPEVTEMSKNHYRYKVKYPFPYVSHLIEVRYPNSNLVFKIRGSLFRVKGYRQIDKELVKQASTNSISTFNFLLICSLVYFFSSNSSLPT